MADQTNLEYLIENGAVEDPAEISETHAKMLNSDFTREEIDAIVKLKSKVSSATFASRGVDAASGMAAL